MKTKPINPPPCCSITPYKQCVECGWKVCRSHWFDADDNPIMDKFHIPTCKEDEDTGVCFCGNTVWRHR